MRPVKGWHLKGKRRREQPRKLLFPSHILDCPRPTQNEIRRLRSLPQLHKELSPARWTLLETLRAEGEMTVYALAKHLGRNYKNVHTDVARLTALGLIEKTRDGKISVPWDVIAAKLKLAA